MIIGIDLGTTNSLAAYFRDGQVCLIKNRLGKTMTPSVVAVDEDGFVLVGELAKEYGYLHPQQVAAAFKRNIGTEHSYRLGDKEFKPWELSSFVLRSLKEDAEKELGEPVTQAIISVPAYFNDLQRHDTKLAGEMAGLHVLRIINEPTASALAYGVGEDQKSQRCLVFDLGGGTFDVSILEYYHGIMEVHAIAGDNRLGGEDFTSAMMDLFCRKKGLVPDSLSPMDRVRLYKSCEAAKCSFGYGERVTVSLKLNGKPMQSSISLSEYNEACGELLQRLRVPIEKAMRDSKVTLADIDRVVLVGGATRLPLITRFIYDTMGMFCSYVVDPDVSVAIGAAVQCGMRARDKAVEEVILTDVCPFTLGTTVVHSNGVFDESGHFLPIINRNTTIPVSKTVRLYTASENQDHITVDVLQGESRYAANNTNIGNLRVNVPVGPRGKESVDVTFTYDVDSILQVEVLVTSTGVYKKTIIQQGRNMLTEDEIRKRFELLSYLKQNPREDEENYHALAKGNRLCTEVPGPQRDRLDQLLFEFEVCLREGSRLEIERKRKELLAFMEEIETENACGFLS